MSTLFILLVSLVTVPAHAETFLTQRSITPPVIAEPTVVGVELPLTVQVEGGMRIVTETGFAIPFETDVVARDLLLKATIESAPSPADTLPRTNVDMIRQQGSFQPVTARTHVFQFTFDDDVTPSELTIDLESGQINAIRVRGGRSESEMKSLFAGPARGGSRVQLSGERVRVLEVYIDVEGVLKIDTMRLLDTPKILFFRAVPGKTYRLLTGARDAANVWFPRYPSFYGQRNPSRLAALGAPSAVTTQDDHDGISVTSDNCPVYWNHDQRDMDSDGLGDVCDPCPSVKNGEDADRNGMCDALEDLDKDGYSFIHDNCPTVTNPYQEDEDADGVGNMCDDSDSRFSADKPWLLWAGIVAMVTVLMGVAALALRKKS